MKEEINTTNVSKSTYMKGFIPFAIAAAVLSLCGGFTAAVPSAIATEWGMGGKGATWITLAFALSAAGMAPIMGKLGDLFGRRAAILIGIGLLGIGELLIGLCPTGNLIFVLISRFILGAGAASIAPVVIGYILTDFPNDKKGKGFSIYMLIASAMVIFGPTLGGIIIHTNGWRLVMYICVAFCAIAFLVCMASVKKTGGGKSLAGFDGLGAIFVLLTFSLFLCLPSFGQSNGWFSRSAIICMVAAVISLIVLIVVEKRAKNPILNGKFIARRKFILPVIILFLTQGLMQSCMTNIILFVLRTQQTTTLSGIATSLMFLGMSIGAIVIGPMADKKEPRFIAIGALIFVALGAAVQMIFTETTGIAIFGISLFLIGLGLGGNGAIFLKVALSDVEPTMAGVGSGTYNMFRDMSAPFGVALFVPMFSKGIQSAVAAGTNVVQANVASIHNTAMIQVVCVIIGIVACFLIPKIHKDNKVKQTV